MSDPETWRQENLRGSSVPPPEIDVTVPYVARVYDFILGGKNNFEPDRRVAAELEEAFPGVTQLAKDNRAFLQRSVRFLVHEAGIRQFIDIGSGLPSAGNVHEIAHQVDPEARVVYVDKDPIVLAHGRALLADNETTTVIQADAADAEAILDDPETKRFIDFDEPFAVLMVGLLHYLSDEQRPAHVTKTFKDAMPSGSYLAATVLLDDDDPRARAVQEKLTSSLGVGWFRPWDQHREYYAGLEMVEPGLVYANDWHPDRNTAVDSQWHTFLSGGVGRKP
jgi:hypothetical protein